MDFERHEERSTVEWSGTGDLLGNMTEAKAAHLAVELAKTLRPGLRPSSLRSLSGLLSLDVVRDQSSSEDVDDLAVAAFRVAKQAIHSVDGGADGAAAVMFGVAAGTRGSLQKDRRRQAARLRGFSVDHFRKHVETALVAEVADEVFYVDSLFRLRRSRGLHGATIPTSSHLGINWLERHETYGRIWTPTYALRADLLALETLRRTDPKAPVYSTYLRASLWWFARVLFEVSRFTERFGGLWLFTDPDDETDVMDSMYAIDFHSCFSEEQNSHLRILVSSAPGQELEAFTASLEASDEGDELAQNWADWVEQCDCEDLDAPRPQCPVHQVISACEKYTQIVDEDWQRLADWYRSPTKSIHGKDVTEFWEQHGGLEKKTRS